MAEEEPVALLSQLSDPCLLAVVRCLACNTASLCNAARAHSRLHQAAMMVLSSIRADIKTQQQVDDSLIPYLGQHGRFVSCMQLIGSGHRFHLNHLPPNLQLTSLELRNTCRPDNGFQGVLGAAGLPVKQLLLSRCTLLDGAEGLAAALPLLPGLEHLSVCIDIRQRIVHFPVHMLQQLQQLTHLELTDMRLRDSPDQASSALQPLQALARLVELILIGLRASPNSAKVHVPLTNGTLSGSSLLTQLAIVGGVELESGALAGKTQLQHLEVSCCSIAGGAAGMGELLSQLQHLQQLTHLSFEYSLRAVEEGNPPAAAFSALTASSQLQFLDISQCTFPAGVWQHMFPPGRQLPQLHTLDISGVQQPSGRHAAPPDGGSLVSCCPGLQSLDMHDLLCVSSSAELLAPLQGLSSLDMLELSLAGGQGALQWWPASVRSQG